MIRSSLRRLTPLIAAVMPITDHDILPDTKTTAEMLKKKLESETPRDRLYKMFSMDEFGIISPELTNIVQATSFGALTGAVYGGFIKSKMAYEDFMSNNQATSFTSMQEAKQKLQNQVTIGFGKGAFMWGWRLALFTCSYITITTVISVYRDRSSIWEYLAAGSLTGALYKFRMGPKGMIVGGGLGLVLGGIAGTISLTVLYLTGTTVQELRHWSYQLEETRNNAKRQMQSGPRTEDPLLEEHIKLLELKKQQQAENTS